MVAGRDAVSKSGIAEVMHILDESLNFLFHHPLARFIKSLTKPGDLVARKRFPKHLNQGAVTRQKHGMCGLCLITFFCGDVQAD